jgi:hypothetical protein
VTKPKPAANSSRLLHAVGLSLEAEKVRWAAIGALAVAYHGVVRASLDADALITFQDSGTNLEGLAKHFRAKGWKAEIRKGDAEDPLGFVLRIQDESGNQVDLIGGIRRLDPGFFKRSLPAEIDGMRLYFAAPEDLLALKVFAGGPKDIEDAKGIVAVIREEIDSELFLRLCRRFGSKEEELGKKLLPPSKRSTA